MVVSLSGSRHKEAREPGEQCQSDFSGDQSCNLPNDPGLDGTPGDSAPDGRAQSMARLFDITF